MVRLFRVSIPTSLIALLVSEAVLLFSCYLLSSLYLHEDPEFFLLYGGGLFKIAGVVVVMMLLLYFSDLYSDYRVRQRTLLLQQVCLAVGGTFLAQATLSYGKLDVILPKWIMIYGSAAALIAVPTWRIFYSNIVSKSIGAQKLLFLGSSTVVGEIMERLSTRPELGLTPIGFIEDQPAGLEAIHGVPCLGGCADLVSIVESRKPDRIIVGMTERRGRLPIEALLDLRFSGIHISEAATLYETVFSRISTRDLRPSHLVFTEELGPRPSSVMLQSFYSLGLGIIGFLIAFPIMVVVFLLVKFTSKGPALYRQTRVGLSEEPFTLYKFRSMYVDAEARTGAVWAVKNDPRITPLGRWLRSLRLDELPQLFNVIRGEMAIVGPRPERPEFVTQLHERIPYYRQRHCVKPGITGWAQINYKYGDTIEDTIVKLEFDLYYIKNLAPALDAYIIFQTIKVMLFSRGAQ